MATDTDGQCRPGWRWIAGGIVVIIVMIVLGMVLADLSNRLATTPALNQYQAGSGLEVRHTIVYR